MCHGTEPKNLTQVQAFKYIKAEMPCSTGHEILAISHYLLVYSNKKLIMSFPE